MPNRLYLPLQMFDSHTKLDHEWFFPSCYHQRIWFQIEEPPVMWWMNTKLMFSHTLQGTLMSWCLKPPKQSVIENEDCKNKQIIWLKAAREAEKVVGKSTWNYHIRGRIGENFISNCVDILKPFIQFYQGCRHAILWIGEHSMVPLQPILENTNLSWV